MTAAGNALAGMILTAPMLRDVAPMSVVKTIDQQSSSATMEDDDDLGLDLEADSAYRVVFTPVYTAAAGDDVEIGFTLPSGASMVYALLHKGTSGGTADTLNLEFGTASSYRYYGGGTSTSRTALLVGTIQMGADAGRLQVQFSRWASTGGTVAMKALSAIDAWQSA